MSYEHLPYRSKAWIRTERLVNYFWCLHKEKRDHGAVWSKLGLCIVKNITTLFHFSAVGHIIITFVLALLYIMIKIKTQLSKEWRTYQILKTVK